jgi:hypothetical protein
MPVAQLEELTAVASVAKVDIGLRFSESGYIGLPYWKERNLEIDIAKDVHPKLGPEKKQAALNAALDKRGLNMEDYKKILQRANHPFYTMTDNDDGTGEIIIPQRVLQSFLNNASQVVPKVIPRIADRGLTFVGVKVEDGRLLTGKTIKDAQTFGRFVKMAESNQRSWSESQYIVDFTATGRLSVDESIIKAEDLMKLMEYGGRYIGIGSGRPQGYGRFSVARWDRV